MMEVAYHGGSGTQPQYSIHSSRHDLGFYSLHSTMRTPSLYSQDDPISAALKPPPTETEAQRQARIFAENEAKRVSEQIDEDLRLERERLRRSKSDVKVSFIVFLLPPLKSMDSQLLLLGQAESGKSTLQKQFQLMYKPNSLDQERLSWRTVIYFNVVHSIKHILSTLEAWDDSVDDVMNIEDSEPVASSSSGSVGKNVSSAVSSAKLAIANLRRRLSPLVAADAELAHRLSGGVTVSGSGKGGVFVRSGWQSRTLDGAGGKTNEPVHRGQVDMHDILVNDVGRMLDVSKNDIKELWAHPTVKGLIAKRRLKLDEWAE